MYKLLFSIGPGEFEVTVRAREDEQLLDETKKCRRCDRQTCAYRQSIEILEVELAPFPRCDPSRQEKVKNAAANVARRILGDKRLICFQPKCIEEFKQELYARLRKRKVIMEDVSMGRIVEGSTH